jgi:hypothetical protein
LTEEQYHLLTKNCDSILQENIESQFIFGISWLHIIREHPSLINKYNFLFKKNKFYSFQAICFLLQIIKSIYRIVVNILIKKEKKNFESQINQKFDIIFVSHLLNKNGVGYEYDFYFDNLPNKLKEDNFRVLVLLINNTDVKSEEAYNKWDNAVAPRLIFPKRMNLANEIWIFKQMLFSGFSLLRKSRKEKDTLKKQLLINASVHSIKESSLTSIRIGHQLNKILEKTSPRYIITTYEGHAWERQCFYVSKLYNKKIFRIGYQHSIIFRLQHSVFNNFSDKFSPDLILTSGKTAFDLFEKSVQLRGVQKDILGSNRGKKININLLNKNIDTILVVPEGLEDECVKLFEFAIKYAKKYHKVKFIFRLHPVIDFNEFSKKYHSFNKIPVNIIISTTTLKEDICNSGIVLYRGSTVVFDAVKSGLMPLYLSCKSEINIDPLFLINNSWKRSIMNDSDLTIAISDYNQNNLISLEKNETIEFCKSVFTPLNYSVLRKYI